MPHRLILSLIKFGSGKQLYSLVLGCSTASAAALCMHTFLMAYMPCDSCLCGIVFAE